MDTAERIRAFAGLGKFLRQFSVNGERMENELNVVFYADMEELIRKVHIHNAWFTEMNVRSAISGITALLDEKELEQWLAPYMSKLDVKKPVCVAVIMAGNIPLVGFHDMLCVLISGNKLLGKLSSDDKLLMPFISRILIHIEPRFENLIEFTEGKMKGIEAVIATGSDNTSRYFEYYFGKYPHIIRKNRNSVAVLSGRENASELTALSHDVFQYYGLGCRNVSKLFVPQGYDFDAFYKALISYGDVMQNNKYMNNYEYNRTVYLMSGDPTLLDNNFLLLRQDTGYASPAGVLYYEHYSDTGELNERLRADKEKIQCIVSSLKEIDKALPFGSAQRPGLADYADDVNTMAFLTANR